MLGLEPIIVQRLEGELAAIAGYPVSVRGVSSTGYREVPVGGVLVVVRIDQGQTPGTTSSAVRISAGWVVDVVGRVSGESAERIDQCFDRVLGCLHNWGVGTQLGRRWGAMQFQNAQPLGPGQFADGVYGITSLFQTSATYQGQQS